MGSKSASKGVYHPRTGKGVFTEALDEKYMQETNLVIELSKQVVDDDTSWALLESKRQALDDEMIAEALAWSYEHGSPRGSRVERLTLDRTKKGYELNVNASWSPTLLTQQRALLAKLNLGNRAPRNSSDIAEEGLRLPIGMRSACLPGDQDLPRRVSSIRRNRQEATWHSAQKNACWRGLLQVDSSSTTMVFKVAAVSRIYRPCVGKDWTPIIGPERTPNPMIPRFQLPVRQTGSRSLSEAEVMDVSARYVWDGSAYTEFSSAWDNTDTLDRI